MTGAIEIDRGPALWSRVERLLGQMPPGYAALFVDPANVRWLTGLAGEPHGVYGMAPLWVAIGPEGESRLVAPAGELAWIEERRGLDGVLAHGSFVLRGEPSAALRRSLRGAPTLVEALEEALVAVGAGRQVIVDDWARPAYLAEATAGLAPTRVLRIETGPVAKARAVKDAAEVAALRRVNRVAEQAVATALARAEPGVTEAEMLAWARGEMVAAGARPMLGSIGFGERGALVDFAPAERRLAAGEAIRLDVGCVLDGYHADLARTAVLGQPPDWLAEAHAALVAGERAAIDTLVPGCTGAELFEAAVTGAREAGLPDYERSHCGHGIGLDMYELPAVRPDAGQPLEVGMTLCLETPLYLIGCAGVQIEDAVHLSASGPERLGGLPQELLAAGGPIPI